MSDQDNIFGGTTPVAAQAEAAPAQQPIAYADKLSGITNETGEPKYANVETALDALATSQQYIPQLHTQIDTMKAELESLRTERAKAEGVQEALAQFQSTQDVPVGTPAPGIDAKPFALSLFKTSLYEILEIFAI